MAIIKLIVSLITTCFSKALHYTLHVKEVAYGAVSSHGISGNVKNDTWRHIFGAKF